MIFITLGSQKFQFNRLLREVDRLIEEDIIKEDVFAQIGYSDYIPQNYKYSQFLDRSEFNKMMNKCDKVITHGGTGAIINAVKSDKKVIAVPRLKKFNEHVDDHQVEIVQQFKEVGFISGIIDISELKESMQSIELQEFKEYVTNTHEIIYSLNKYIESI